MDLTRDPNWRPLTGDITSGDWRIRVWQEPRLPGETTRDPFCLRTFGDTLRLAVADPAATNPAITAEQVAWSGELAIGALNVHTGLDAAFTAAAARIRQPGTHPRLANPCAQVAAVDVTMTTGHVTALRAGDCEVWIRSRDSWRPLLAGPRLTPAAHAAFAAHPGAKLTADREQLHYQAHLDTLEDPEAWLTAPLGLDAAPRTQGAQHPSVQEIIVTSDGARLTADRCANLDVWLRGGLQHAPAGHPHPSPHGDVTVLHARRTA